MTKKIEDGGPAFPFVTTETNEHGLVFPFVVSGMSLRDWFAGQALAGIVAGLCSNSERGDKAYDRVGFTDAAKDAYTIADAMLTARKAGEA